MVCQSKHLLGEHLPKQQFLAIIVKV